MSIQSLLTTKKRTAAARFRRTYGRIVRFFLKRGIQDIMASDYLVYGIESRVTVSPKAQVNNALFNTISGTISIANYAFFGHNVCCLTGTHDITKKGLERMASIPKEGRDIVIEEGVWVGSGTTIIGPCHIGKNAVIAAGSVVLHDVPPDCLVGGVPARHIKTIVFSDGEPMSSEGTGS